MFRSAHLTANPSVEVAESAGVRARKPRF